MAGKRINPRLVKKHHVYLVETLARRLGVHKNSVRNWVTQGLRPIDDRRPMMFRGVDVIAFLEARRAKNKRRCPAGTMYCLKCREPSAPALGIVDCYRPNATTGNLQALCETCETIMNRRVSLARISSVMPDLDVQFPQVPSRLKGCRNPPLNCDSAKEGKPS